MQRRTRLLALAVVMLAATACEPITSPTGQSGSAAEVGTAIVTPESPSAIPSAPVPTADATGQYRNLTFAEAQQLAQFQIAQPIWVPPYLEKAGIIASVPNITEIETTPPATPTTLGAGTVQVVSMSFVVSGPGEFGVTIYERKQGTSLGPPWDPSTITATATITIAGHRVTRTSRANVAITPNLYANTSYVWNDRGTTFQLLALVIDPVTHRDIQHMIASMLGQGYVP